MMADHPTGGLDICSVFCPKYGTRFYDKPGENISRKVTFMNITIFVVSFY